MIPNVMFKYAPANHRPVFPIGAVLHNGYRKE